MNFTRAGSIICTLTLAACVTDRSDTNDAFDGNGPDGSGSSQNSGDADGGNDDGGGDDGGTSGGGGDGGGIKYDVDPGTGSGNGDPDGDEICGKVDFLFVIDNSDSMLDFQRNLVDNWPAFISGIQSTLTEVDSYNVGVISSDEEYRFNVEECRVLSGLIVQKRLDRETVVCGPYANGLNFMTEVDDLETTFDCAVTMEAGGNLELTMASLQAAVERQLGGPGECNEGFLRDDSLLIIVILTDECDGPGSVDQDGNPLAKSPGTPTDWYDAVVAARGGIESNIVVMSLLQYDGGACPPPSMTPEQHEYYDGANIKQFTEMFTHGIVGGICEPDFGPYFQNAIDVIDVACEEYVPPQG